jgi:hypothetical protein
VIRDSLAVVASFEGVSIDPRNGPTASANRRQPFPLAAAGSRTGEPFLAQREAVSMVLAAKRRGAPALLLWSAIGAAGGDGQIAFWEQQ